MLASASQKHSPRGWKSSCLYRTVKIGDNFSMFKAVHSCIVLYYLVLCLLPSSLGGDLEVEFMCSPEEESGGDFAL